MDAKMLDTWGKRIREIDEVDLPIHLNALAKKMKISPAKMSVVMHCLEVAGRVRMKKAGQTWLLVEVVG
jgi:DNA-binding Lrp family transcriptional regulator